MFFLLYQYLIENANLHLPGIGTLEFTEAPARLDVAEKQILPPQKIIQLNIDASNATDNHALMDFISHALAINKEHAQTLFQQFNHSIHSYLTTERVAHWHHLGSFQKNESGAVQFIQTHQLEEYLLPVYAERIIRHQAEHSITVGNKETTNIAMQQYYDRVDTLPKNYWWVWAILIFVISSILIWLKHFN